MIYLDNAATTKVSPSVSKAVYPYLTECYGNAGSMYELGRISAEAIQVARNRVADFIGAKPKQIIFTSGGSEANNLVLSGMAPSLKLSGQGIVSTKIEHHSILRTLEGLINRGEIDLVRFLKCGVSGKLNPKTLNENLENIGLVSVMYVNNETGIKNDVKELAKIAHKNNVLFHTDCVQAAGFHPINVDELGCDFLSISSHKIHGFKGMGALYVRNFDYLEPLIYGGREQEFGYRGGTENVAGIVGFGEACESARIHLKENREHIDNVVRCFITALYKEGIQDYQILSPLSDTKIVSVLFKNVDAQSLVAALDSQGVCISAGSACRSQETEPSHVLLDLGLSNLQARMVVRYSFSEYNTEDEALEAAKITADCVSVIRGL